MIIMLLPRPMPTSFVQDVSKWRRYHLALILPLKATYHISALRTLCQDEQTLYSLCVPYFPLSPLFSGMGSSPFSLHLKLLLGFDWLCVSAHPSSLQDHLPPTRAFALPLESCSIYYLCSWFRGHTPHTSSAFIFPSWSRLSQRHYPLWVLVPLFFPLATTPPHRIISVLAPIGSSFPPLHRVFLTYGF